MSDTKRVLLELPETLLSRVDEARRLVPRNAWIREAIDLHLSDVPARNTGVAGGTQHASPTPEPKEQPVRKPKSEPQSAIHKYEAVSKYDSACKHCGQRERTH